MSGLRVVSGGQTGVDRAALDAALAAGVPCAGWCPRGRRAEDGPIADRYPLRETKSRTYARRTMDNVLDSDATLIVLNDPVGGLSGGTRLTVGEAEKAGRPLLIINLADSPALDHQVDRIADWINENRIFVLNVAGPRESGCPGIYQAAHELMTGLLTVMKRDAP